MIIQELKGRILGKQVQAVLLDTKGTIIESCDSLFPLVEFKGKSLSRHIADFNLYLPEIASLSINEEFAVPEVALETGGLTKKYQMTLKCLRSDQSVSYICLFQDYTEHYEEFHNVQLERDEAFLRNSLLEIQKKSLELEKKLLHIKNQEIEKQHAFKSQFFAEISHEIRTPVNGIVGICKMLADKKVSKQAEYLSALEASSLHLLSIVNDVLDLSKIEAGKIEFESVEIVLDQICFEIKSSFLFISKEKEIAFAIEIDPSLPNAILGDRVKLKQILYNIVGNAFKFTPQKGQINLKISESIKVDRLITFEISDSGIGMEQSEIDKVFQPYQQANKEIKGAYGGTGLGLSIVKKLVELQDGMIAIKSEPAKGTNVFFDLPLHPSTNTAVDIKVEKDQFDDIFRRVFVAEDDRVSQKIIKEFLIQWGFDPEVCASADVLLKKAEKEPFDLLILDYHLGEETGVNLLKKLRSKGIDVPVIVFSGKAPQEIAQEFSEMKIDGFVQKPVQPQTLLAAIRKIAKKELKGEIIDLSSLTALTNNDDGLIKEIVQVFIETIPQDISSIKTLIDLDDLEQLAKKLHKLKPNFIYVGLQGLFELTDHFEAQVEMNAGKENYIKWHQEIQNGVNFAVKALRNYLERKI